MISMDFAKAVYKVPHISLADLGKEGPKSTKVGSIIDKFKNNDKISEAHTDVCTPQQSRYRKCIVLPKSTRRGTRSDLLSIIQKQLNKHVIVRDC